MTSSRPQTITTQTEFLAEVHAHRGWVYNKYRKAWLLWRGVFTVRAVIRRRKRGWYLCIEPNYHTVYVFPTFEGAKFAAEMMI